MTDGLVIFTFGSEEVRNARKGEAVQRFPAFKIEAKDTTGGGDSFRGGIVYGFLQSRSDKKTIELASALAAMVCQRFPGVLDSQSLQEVTDYIGKN